MNDLITIKKTRDYTKYKVYFQNKKFLGYFVLDVDGDFYFLEDESNKGLWSDYALIAIGKKLMELNKNNWFNI